MLVELQKNPVLEQLIFDLRDPETGPELFRYKAEWAGSFLGYEIAKNLDTEDRKVKTVMDAYATHIVLKEDPVIFNILRAGTPVAQGLHKAFPGADVGFYGAMRDEDTAIATVSYTTTPDITDKFVIIGDIMLATGGSIIESLDHMKAKYRPGKISLAILIAAQEGIERIQEYDPTIDIYAAAIDPVLNEVKYIIPGLGDAGDRCYGIKAEKRLENSVNGK